MGNNPVIMMVARSIPPEIQERYNKWYDGVYALIYMKTGFVKEIDRYVNMKKSYTMPDDFRIYHADNFEDWEKQAVNTDRNSAIRDQQITSSQIPRWWHSVYELMRCFKNAQSPQGTYGNTIVDAPVIHIEGYRIPESDSGKYEDWFNQWASHVYIPLLLKIPGVKASNFFTLLDYKDSAFSTTRFIEPHMPRFISITYFDSPESVDTFNRSIELAAFRGSMALAFPEMRPMWDTEFQLTKTYKPQP